MTEPTRILIVDDDAEIREILSERLRQYGFFAQAANGGEAMFAALKKDVFDVILLDVMMPGEDGLTLCRRLRAPDAPTARTPIIFLTALGDTADKVIGLELGGDDYLPKPFQTRELIARIRAVARRAQNASGDGRGMTAADDRSLWLFGPWKLDPLARHLIDAQGTVIPLSATEFRLLLLFLERPQRVLSRDQIMEYTVGHHADVFDRSVDVQISRLRGKLREHHGGDGEQEIIRTMRGDGYILALPVTRERTT
jgi:two-component system OmpR family response regulator